VLFVSENWSNAHRENPYSLNPVKSIATSIRQQKNLSVAALNTLQRRDRAITQGEAIFNSIDPTLNEDVFSKLLNRIQVIRVFTVRVTPIFTSKKHALNT
jgi:hypothetical protein